ncbi:MAG: ABC transporter permease [Spirochaetaceae bacterium]
MRPAGRPGGGSRGGPAGAGPAGGPGGKGPRRTGVLGGRARDYLHILAAAAFLIAVWHVASRAVGLEIILPSPAVTLRRFLRIASTPSFGVSVGTTVGRGMAGFALAAGLGLACGAAAGLRPALEKLFVPLVTVIRSTPVVAFILIALIWFDTDVVPVFVTVLMTVPIIYENIVEGIRAVDPRLTELSRAYRVGRRRVWLRLYLPSLFPFLAAAGRTALGLTWKVVVAAEVLSLPNLGVGAELQEARYMLNTAEVFAWTAVAVLLSAVTDLAFALLTRKRRRIAARGAET